MNTAKVCILGGSGFVGIALANRLMQQGVLVRVLTRQRERARELLVLPTAEVIEADVHDEAALAQWFAGQGAIVNLVGVLHGGRRDESFQAAHVGLAKKVIGAMRSAGVQRLLHMSALRADPAGPSDYLRTKGEAEALVRSATDLTTTIFRPSVIFGIGDSLLNRFAALAKAAPVLPLAHAGARFQPIHVVDVARAFAASLDDPRSFGQTYDLCGPRVYTLRELVQLVGELTHHERPIMDLPPALGMLQALILEFLPGKLMSRDNLRSLSVDSVSSAPFPEVFGFKPSTLESIAPS